MQKLVDTGDASATSHQLSYNVTESLSLCFKPNQIKITLPSFALGKHVDKCRYLGTIVNETNCDKRF